MKIDTAYIEKLAKILSDNNLTEIALEDENSAITIRKQGYVVPPVVTNSVTVEESAEIEEVKPEKSSENRKEITSPMVGNFYSAASPGAKPFVQVGDIVKEGDVVCIVEAMKLMNEIVSEVSGKIVEVCVEDGQPVEFGQVLMYVE
ncbi:acetyl-CoA carboxylase biotin carboxyl carrier protein [bacterium]|nr:acetyl-CoA carboxylase biotin carboxyl carrier protein [bacterium]